MKNLLSTITLLAAVSVFSPVAFAADAAPAAGDADVNTACSTDAKTAGCEKETAGSGLVKCLWQYKKNQRKTNKSFAYSEGCEKAFKKFRSEKHASK